MVNVGIVGMGFIGQQHYQIWSNVEGAQILAVADKEVEKVAESAEAVGGNIGEAETVDLSDVERYTDIDDLLEAGGIDLVDLCLPTHIHAPMAQKVLDAGYDCVCEKPMAQTVPECRQMIDAAHANDGKLFVAHCIRFWPEYEVLARMIENGDLGRIVSMKLTRLSPTPGWSQNGWLNDPAKSGGALLDLHIHDADFIMSVMGMPNAVFARGGNIIPEGPPVDHIMTHYIYDGTPVFAEGGWAMPPDYPFEMAFDVLGENGCLKFSVNADPTLMFYPSQGEPYTPEFRPVDGYLQELEYFAKCVEDDVQPARVTPEDALNAVRLVLAERESIESGTPVQL